MTLPSVFISYNPNSDIEETLAVRLYTIGAVHGFNMLLPDRRGLGGFVSAETRSRILMADFFILFSTTSLSKAVINEIELAANKLHDKSKILVIYDDSVGKNLKGADHFTEVYVNRSSSVEDILKTIIAKIKDIQSGGKKQNGFFSVLGPILLTGLGLFALAHVLDEPAKPRKPSKKKSIPAKGLKRAAKKVAG